MLKIPFIIHYHVKVHKSSTYSYIKKVYFSTVFNSANRNQLDLSRSRRSDRPYVTFDFRNMHATPTFEGAWLTLMNENGQ